MTAGLAGTTVYRNAEFLTMDDSMPTAEAIAVRGDRILAVGSLADVIDAAGPEATMVDLGGRTALPGFVEPHNHFTMVGKWLGRDVQLFSPPAGPNTCIADVVQRMRERAEQLEPGTWIQGWGYDDTSLAERRHLTRYDLDQASTTHPIWISHVSGHVGVANSLALEMTGIGVKTATPEGGAIDRDAKGVPTGLLAERPAMNLLRQFIPEPGFEELVEDMRKANEEMLRVGVTSAVDCSGESARVFRAAQEARRRGWLPVRASLMIRTNLAYGDEGSKLGYVTGLGDEHMKLGAFKIGSDGSIQAYTAWLTEPYFTAYEGDPTYRGFPVIEPDRLSDLVVGVHRGGFQVAVHANGDAAIDAVLDAIERAQREYPRPDARHRIEHCQNVREDQIARMAELGVSPSFFVAHTLYYGDRHREIFLGPERARSISALQWALKYGVRFSLHSDWPVTPIDPLLSVDCAVNRTTRAGEVLGPEQRIGVWEALKAVTIDSAWQDFEEHSRGSLTVGKLADITVLEENPMNVDPSRIKDIQVAAVVIDGETVHDPSGLLGSLIGTSARILVAGIAACPSCHGDGDYDERRTHLETCERVAA